MEVADAMAIVAEMGVDVIGIQQAEGDQLEHRGPREVVGTARRENLEQGADHGAGVAHRGRARVHSPSP